MDKTTSITTIKKEMQLQEWSAQIKAQQASGLTIREWCKEKGIKPNTYYNRLRKVREKYIENSPTIVPVSVPCSNENIRIEKKRTSNISSGRYICGHSDRFGA
ncbi:IS66 family insertion sequence element accessory protein TnpA [Ruminococcus albus]|uniref:Uncharacterized protein n=1 Tax=Ruminococcus albus (strain ATCC 27210 / DSM 20455 / JCM 14654 / NCDO 2250 / 7) TaxID=697329 RepID=E6UD63_RUMA7|nr:hypothetical protein [Ruminococcus albus]ADU21668.1 hypothetical protein Rumal_1146 [Ruminococcus albus 7 = DSM 20455]